MNNEATPMDFESLEAELLRLNLTNLDAKLKELGITEAFPEGTTKRVIVKRTIEILKGNKPDEDDSQSDDSAPVNTEEDKAVDKTVPPPSNTGTEEKQTEERGVETYKISKSARMAIARKVQKELEKHPKIGYIIPLRDGEKAGEAYESVTINGARFEVKKGEFVELPKPIADMLAHKHSYNLGTKTIPAERNVKFMQRRGEGQ